MQEVTVEDVIKLVQVGKHKDAEVLVKDLPTGKFVLGVVHEGQGNLEIAKKYYAEDGTVNSIHNLGCLYVREQDWATAKACFDAAITVEPGFIKSLNNAAVCALQINPESYMTAIGYFKMIIDSTNNTEVPLHNVELLKDHVFDCTDNEQCAIALHNIGFLQMKVNNIYVCQIVLERSYDLLKNYPETLYTLGVLYNGFTLRSEPRASADQMLAWTHDFYAKKVGKEVKSLTEYRMLPGAENYYVYVVPQVTISKGKMQTPDAVVITHHGPHIPVQRYALVPGKRFQKAVNCLQYNSWGYYHWLIETLPRLIIGCQLDVDVVLVSDKSFVRDLIRELLPFVPELKKAVFVGPAENVYIEVAYVVDWDCVPESASAPASLKSREFLVPHSITQMSRTTLRPLLDKYAADILGVSSGGRPLVVWLCRGNVPMRKCETEALLAETLATFVPKAYDFLAFTPEEHTLESTIRVMSRCRVLIGIHGGAFSNMLFCPPGAVIVEIGMMEPFYHYYFRHLAESLGHKHIMLAHDIPNMFNAPSIHVQPEPIAKIVKDVCEALSMSV